MANNMDQRALSAAVTKFAAKFCNELEKDKSVVSSPLSAELVLALLTLGTTDPAHAELLTALDIPDDNSVRSLFSQVTSNLKSLKGITLNVANKVYIMEGDYDLQPDIKNDADMVFDAEIQKMDFNKSAESAKTINIWVENKTNKKIKDLCSPDSFSGDTRLVLVNALYFKGTWAKPFNPKKTRDLPFHMNAETTIDVPMMCQETKFYYKNSKDLHAQLLAMPYVGDEARMLIVLPREVEGLSAIMAKLADGYNLMDEVEKMLFKKVLVAIPKFKIETEIDLKTLLPKLGIEQIFDKENSGLTKLLNVPEPLYVSKAVQKAFIEVNEEGTEAAAATGGWIPLCMPPQFRANHPFLYLLTGSDHTILFAGIYRGTA